MQPTSLARFAVLAILVGCEATPITEPSLDEASEPATPVAVVHGPKNVDEPPAIGSLTSTGSSIARSVDGTTLYVADEANRALLVVPETLLWEGKKRTLAPGVVTVSSRPAQIVVLGDDHVLVTLREEGAVVLMKPDSARGLVEIARASVAPDAWGIAATGNVAVVSSACSHTVSIVEIPAMRVTKTFDVAREPRGVAIAKGGRTAYISHLTSATITKVTTDGQMATFILPPAPFRNAASAPLPATLTYALALSPDGERLYAARHAIGASGINVWFGTNTVDVVQTATDTPLAPSVGHDVVRAPNAPQNRMVDNDGERGAHPLAIADLTPFAQPRGIAYRETKKSIVVVSEGNATVTELDARAIDPTLAIRKKLFMPNCSAPSGLVLSRDEKTAFAFCQASFTLGVVALDTDSFEGFSVRIGKDPLPPRAALGRRVFHDAMDSNVSGGMACSGCHPEGRDDGQVWREVETRDVPFDMPFDVEPRVFVGGPHATGGLLGRARQTPMLAGRVASNGPFGWHAENPDLVSRLTEGVHLHRWLAAPSYDDPETNAAIDALAEYLRVGLVAPPRTTHPQSDIEKRGEAIFKSGETKCTSCHIDSEYTDRMPHGLGVWESPGYDRDDLPFRTPSLLYVGSTAPYFHDGSETTLEQLLLDNHDRMGKTSHLSADDRAALAAFLRTL